MTAILGSALRRWLGLLCAGLTIGVAGAQPVNERFNPDQWVLMVDRAGALPLRAGRGSALVVVPESGDRIVSPSDGEVVYLGRLEWGREGLVIHHGAGLYSMITVPNGQPFREGIDKEGTRVRRTEAIGVFESSMGHVEWDLVETRSTVPAGSNGPLWVDFQRNPEASVALVLAGRQLEKLSLVRRASLEIIDPDRAVSDFRGVQINVQGTPLPGIRRLPMMALVPFGSVKVDIIEKGRIVDSSISERFFLPHGDRALIRMGRKGSTGFEVAELRLEPEGDAALKAFAQKLDPDSAPGNRREPTGSASPLALASVASGVTADTTVPKPEATGAAPSAASVTGSASGSAGPSTEREDRERANRRDPAQAQEEEERRSAEARRMAQERRLAEELRVAQEQRAAQEMRVAEERRLAEERQLAEDRRLAQEREQERQRTEASERAREKQLAEARDRERVTLQAQAEAERARLLAEKRRSDEEAARARDELDRVRRQLALAEQMAAERAAAEKAQVAVSYRPGRRRALVIGNDSYSRVTALETARADARAMAGTLRGLGFDVTLRLDLDVSSMRATLREFKALTQGGDEVLFFFAGHGVQLGGSNYLLPTTVKGESEDEVKDEAVQLQRVLDDMQEKSVGFMLAIIDACRDNPFKGQGRSIGGRGLVPTSAATGQMIIFSAGSGQQALDKLNQSDNEGNGVFTRVFLKEMVKPGVRVDQVLRNVRTEVVKLARSVGKEQTPALYDQTLGDFYFKP